MNFKEKNMKNLLLILMTALALYSVGVNADIGNVDKSVSVDNAGTLLGGVEKYFVKVKNSSGNSRAAGSTAVLDYTADDGYSVTGTTSFGDQPMCMIAETCASGATCLCQTYGYTDILLFSAAGGASVAGGRLFASTASNGYFQAHPIAVVQAVTSYSWGVFYDVSTVSGAVEAFLRMR